MAILVIFPVLVLVSASAQATQWFNPNYQVVSFHTPEVSIGQLGNWDSDTLSLYFTNYNGTDLEPSLFRFDYIEKELYGAFLNGSTPNFLLRVGQPWEHLFVIGTDNHGFLIEWDGNSPNATTLETLFTLPPDNFLTHTDFATPSPGGRLFGGGLPKTFCGAPANLTFPFYSYDHKNGFQILENGTRTSNGIVFDYFRGKMYRLDSCERIIVQYDYDFLTDSISNETVIFDTNTVIDKDLIFTDLAIDTEGRLYTASFPTGGIFVIDPRTQEHQVIDFPIVGPGGLVFGGPGLDTLFIIVDSTLVDINTATIIGVQHPGSAVFAIEGLGVCGQYPGSLNKTKILGL